MTVSHVLFVLLLCALTGSYTWGMRGTIIGGERGAMLPGAALALILLFAGGSVPVATAFPLAASIGAAGMFFGGSQTYGETLKLTNSAKHAVRRRGHFGLALKGAGWFGVFGAVLGFGIGTMAGRYALWEVIFFVVMLPIVYGLGVLLLNSPYKPKKKKYPKFYFSESRREVWGGTLLVLLYILVFAACKREWFTLLLGMFGFIFGAIGFFVGNLFRLLFDAFLPKPWFSGWKAMECAFGAIGAAGIGLGWCLFYGSFVSRYAYEITAHSGAWSPLSSKAYTLLGFIWLLLLALFIARYWFPLPNSKQSKKNSDILFGAEDVLIYPVFCLYPLFLGAVGDLFFAQIFSFFGMIYLLPDKIIFGVKQKYKNQTLRMILHSALVLLCAVILFAQLFLNVKLSAYGTWFVYLPVYWVVTMIVKLDPIRFRASLQELGFFKKAFLSLNAEPTWLFYAGVCVIALLILGKPYFSI